LIEIESLSDVRFIGKLSESDDFLQILLDVVRDIEII
jgi:hypothetical protein